MSEQKLFLALGQVDDQYIAETQFSGKNTKLRKAVLIAACIALLAVLCGSAYAIAEGSLSFLGTSSNTWEDGTIEIGYQIEAVMDEMPEKELKGDVREVKGIIRTQIRTYKPYMSSLPQCWRGKYDTSAEMLEYLGCAHVSFPDFGWQEEWSYLYVDAKDLWGNFQRVCAEVHSTYGNYRIFTDATMYFDLSSDRVTIGSLDQYRDSYTQETYVTEDGRTAVIVCAWKGINLSYVDGYVVVGNVLYGIHLIGGGHTEQMHKDAIAVVQQWLDAL